MARPIPVVCHGPDQHRGLQGNAGHDIWEDYLGDTRRVSRGGPVSWGVIRFLVNYI